MPEVIDLDQKLSLFSEHWHPRIVASLNDQHVKLAKLQGEFIWHRHPAEDELFLVVKGSLLIRLRDQDLHLAPGQLVVIPRGVEHMPVAVEEVHVLLLEPASTINTGDAPGVRTTRAEWI
jgi:mannose-6-phosphate isomerase-like protein (cupin superfamily)